MPRYYCPAESSGLRCYECYIDNVGEAVNAADTTKLRAFRAATKHTRKWLVWHPAVGCTQAENESVDASQH